MNSRPWPGKLPSNPKITHARLTDTTRAYPTWLAGRIHRYCGEQWDADLELYFLRARYYNPQLGRFASLDTFEGRKMEPLSLNRYSYTMNSPISKVDPSGHEDCMSFISSLMEIKSMFMGKKFTVTSIGSGGPEIGKALKRNLLEVERDWYRLEDDQKLRAAFELRDAFWSAIPPIATRGSAVAWDILPLERAGRDARNGLVMPTKTYRVGVGDDNQGIVAFEGKCYYASAVNFALFGKMYKLCHDFLIAKPQGSIADPEDWNLESAYAVTRAWKHGMYGDFTETERQSEAFITFGYNGTLPSWAHSLKFKPNKEEVLEKSLDWCWEPFKPRR